MTQPATDTWSLANPNAFDGEALDGTWTLTVTDHVKDSILGTLQSWSMTVTPQPSGAMAATGEAGTLDAASNDALFGLLAVTQIVQDSEDANFGPLQDRKQDTPTALAIVGLH